MLKRVIIVILDYINYGLNEKELLKRHNNVLVAPLFTGDILFSDGFLQLVLVNINIDIFRDKKYCFFHEAPKHSYAILDVNGKNYPNLPGI